MKKMFVVICYLQDLEITADPVCIFEEEVEAEKYKNYLNNEKEEFEINYGVEAINCYENNIQAIRFEEVEE